MTTNLEQSAKEIKHLFKSEGITIAEWARERNFDVSITYKVLSGKLKCTHGRSYDIAVALGLTTGEKRDVSKLDKKLRLRKEGIVDM